MLYTGHKPGLGRSTSPWPDARTDEIYRKEIIDNASRTRITLVKANVCGMDGREIVDAATTGAVREN